MYKIKHLTNLDKDYYGYSSAFEINFKFNKQTAKVTLGINDNLPNKCRLYSGTDGYHWLQYFLSQDIETEKLLDRSYNDEILICKNLFTPYYINYEQEGKDTAILTWKIHNEINEEFVHIVASIIEPRFANRERFFEN